jgi:hypothetical protein
VGTRNPSATTRSRAPLLTAARSGVAVSSVTARSRARHRPAVRSAIRASSVTAPSPARHRPDTITGHRRGTSMNRRTRPTRTGRCRTERTEVRRTATRLRPRERTGVRRTVMGPGRRGPRAHTVTEPTERATGAVSRLCQPSGRPPDATDDLLRGGRGLKIERSRADVDRRVEQRALSGNDSRCRVGYGGEVGVRGLSLTLCEPSSAPRAPSSQDATVPSPDFLQNGNRLLVTR